MAKDKNYENGVEITVNGLTYTVYSKEEEDQLRQEVDNTEGAEINEEAPSENQDLGNQQSSTESATVEQDPQAQSTETDPSQTSRKKGLDLSLGSGSLESKIANGTATQEEVEEWINNHVNDLHKRPLTNNDGNLPDDGGFFEDLWVSVQQGIGTGTSVNEGFDIFNKGAEADDAEIQDWIDASLRMRSIVQTHEQLAFQKSQEKNGGGIKGTLKSLYENPGFLPQMIATSMATMVTSLESEEVVASTSLGAGAGAGVTWYTGWGAIVGTMSGATMGLTGAMETSLTLSELLGEELEDMGLEPHEWNTANVRTILEDEDAIERMKNKALARGIAIGAFEGLTMGLSRGVGGKLLTLKAGPKTITATTAITEGVGGSLGEVAGQIAAGGVGEGEDGSFDIQAGLENIDAGEALLEGIAELKGVVNTTDIVAEANSQIANTTGINIGETVEQMIKKSEYTVNGEKTTKSEIDNIINSENIDAEDLAKIKIEVKNDTDFQNKVNEKQNDAVIETQISEKVIDTNDRKKLVDLQKEKIQAESDVKKEGSSKVPGADEKLQDVNKQIDGIIEKYKDVDVNSKEVIDQKKRSRKIRKIVRDRSLDKTIKFAEEQGKLIGKETVVVENNADAQSAYNRAIDEYNSKNPNKQIQKQDVKNADGFIVGDTIFINKDIAGRTGAISVGSHEVLHGVLQKHMQGLSTNEKRNLVSDFKNVLTDEQKTAIESRLKENYNDVADFDINTTDEWFTGFSDAIERGDITFNESTFDKVRNLIQEIARKFGIKKDFANGRQAYNFLKDYSRSIAKNKLSGRAMKLAAEGKQLRNEFKLAASRSTVNLDTGKGDLSARIDSYTKEAKTKEEFQKPGGGFDDVYSGILEGKFDRVLGEGLTQDQRDIMRQELADRLINYDPTKTPELSKWMYGGSGKGGNIQFANLEAKKKLFEEGQKRKKEVRGDVVQEGTGKTVFESIADTQTELTETEVSNQKKYSKLRRDLGLDNKMMNKVRDAVITTFGTNLPNVDSKKFRAALEKNFRTMLKKPIQDLIGSRDSYNNFITKHFEAVFNALPVETLIQMERNVAPENRIFTTSERITKPTEVDALISKGKLPKDTNRTSGPQLHTKNKYPGQNKVMSYFRGIDMKNQLGYEVGGSTLGTRKDKLAMEIGVELGFDATMEVVQTKEVAEKRSAILELQGKEQLSNETAIIAKQIDRDPTVKFSKSMENAKKDNALNNLDLSKMFKENSIGWIEANFPTVHDALSIMFDNKYGPTTYENKGFLTMISEADPNLAKLAKDKVHQTVKTKTVDGKKVKLFDKKKLKDHESNYVLPLLDFIPPWMGKRDLSQKNGNNRFLENTILKGTSDRGNVGDGTAQSRNKSREKFRNKLNNDMGKNLTPETKKAWAEFEKVKDKLQLAESTFDMPETLLRKIREIQASDMTAKQKVKEAQKLYDYGSLDAAQKLYKAINASTQDWVNFQVESGKMTREEAIAYVIRDKQKNTNFTKGERALAAFTSVQFSDGPQVVSKKDYKGEHVKDSATVSAQSVISIYNNTFNQDADAILGGYEQSYIPKKWANEMDKLGGANSPLKNRRFILNPEIGKNVYDLKTGKSMYELELGKFAIEQSKMLEQSHTNSTKIKSAQNAVETRKKYEKDGKKRGMSTFDFDETLIIDGKNFVIATDPVTGKKTKISSADWPTKGTKLAEQGFKMNFDDFVNVRGGVKGPLFQKLLNRIDKFGTNNNFILTARPQESAVAIHGWLKSKGVNIPLKNITGLGDSRASSKAQWMLDKFAEGFNDMYFVDDALPNVKAVQDIMNQLDVKGSSVQAKTKVMVGPYLVDTTNEKGRSFINDWNNNPDVRTSEFKISEDWIVDTRTKDGKNIIKKSGVKFSKSPTVEFNEMLERKFKVGKEKVFSDAEARTRGEKKGKNIFKNFFIPPSAEDFKGLLYDFLGTGKQGDADLVFFKNTLLTPFAEGIRNWNTFKQNMSDQYTELRKTHKNVTKSLNERVGDTSFTNDTAIRVYLWDKNNMDIPGIAETTKKKLVDHVKNNPELSGFADILGNISNAKDGYVAPNRNWMVESIGSDLNNAVNNVGRAQFLSDFIDNKNEIFSQENLNKIEAIKGTGFREALENMLHRMETGNNRITGKDKNVNRFLDWVNGSVGAVMFMNIRSAVLQTISTVNFINWGDNNVFKASKAFANQPQFWKDFSTIFNSDMLKQRRAGLAIDVSASELTKTFSEGGKSMTDKSKSVIRYLLEKGFAPTRAADSFAISMGGASFYRNRLETYKKKGMSEADAQKKAFLDFQEVAEETQQSSRPDLISMQQAGTLGRIILAWQNTPMQMTRLTKKALSDIVNRRGDMKTNISKLMYYGVAQNLIFGALQTGLMFMLFGTDEEEERKKEKEKRVLNGALDSLLRGTGVYGAAVATLKNTILKWQQERKKNFAQRDDTRIILEAINFSPPIGSKLRKINSAIKTDRFNKGVSDKLKFRIENPKLSIAANSIEALTNIPLARLVNKANNVEEALTGNHEIWQRVALMSGWNRWDVGVEDEELEQAKIEAKEERKAIKQKEKELKKIEEEKRKQEEKKAEEERKKKEGIKTVQCSGTKSNGQRCSLTTETKADSWLCQYHKSYKPNETTDTDGDGIKEVQCTAITGSGKRCKNRTENKNKKCYAHQ